MIIDWNIDDIKAQVDCIAWAESDDRMNGFICWGRKKDLYELYWYIEDKLEKCKSYTPEDAFLEERREAKIVRKLGGSIED